MYTAQQPLYTNLYTTQKTTSVPCRLHVGIKKTYPPRFPPVLPFRPRL